MTTTPHRRDSNEHRGAEDAAALKQAFDNLWQGMAPKLDASSFPDDGLQITFKGEGIKAGWTPVLPGLLALLHGLGDARPAVDLKCAMSLELLRAHDVTPRHWHAPDVPSIPCLDALVNA